MRHVGHIVISAIHAGTLRYVTLLRRVPTIFFVVQHRKIFSSKTLTLRVASKVASEV